MLHLFPLSFLPPFLPCFLSRFLSSFLPSFLRSFLHTFIVVAETMITLDTRTLLFRIFFGKPYLMDSDTSARACVYVCVLEVKWISFHSTLVIVSISSLRWSDSSPHNTTARRDRPRNSGDSKLYITFEFFFVRMEPQRDSYCRVVLSRP